MHEVAHLEWVPPYCKSVTQFMDFSKDGMTQIQDLNQMENLVMHNGDKYWNPKLKEEFISNLSKMWDESYYKEGLAKEQLMEAVPAKEVA